MHVLSLVSHSAWRGKRYFEVINKSLSKAGVRMRRVDYTVRAWSQHPLELALSWESKQQMGCKEESHPWSAQGRAIQRGELMLPAQGPFWHCKVRRSVFLKVNGLSLLLCPYTAKQTGKERGNRVVLQGVREGTAQKRLRRVWFKPTSIEKTCSRVPAIQYAGTVG